MATIRKRGEKYQTQVRRSGHPSVTKSFSTKQDAERWGREMDVKIDRRESAPDTSLLSELTLGDLVQRYWDQVTSKKKGWSQETYRLNAFLRHPICQKKLSHISSCDFARYRDERLNKIKPKSLHTEFSPLHNLFEIARDEWGIPIPENPLDKVRVRFTDDRRQRRLKAGELKRILVAASKKQNPYIIPITLFAIETAMRRGEILSITWEDIDWRKKTLKIAEAKNGHTRLIPLTPLAFRILSQQAFNRFISSGGDFKQAAGTAGTEDNREGCANFANFLLPSGASPKVPIENLSRCDFKETSNTSLRKGINRSSGNDNLRALSKAPEWWSHDLRNGDEKVFPISANAFRLNWERSKKQEQVKDLRFHDLRHEAISRYFEMGLTVPEVALISGHKDARMLLRYAHGQLSLVQIKLNSFSSL